MPGSVQISVGLKPHPVRKFATIHRARGAAAGKERRGCALTSWESLTDNKFLNQNRAQMLAHL